VVFALSLPVLIMLLTLCIEAGRLFYVRSVMQALADHAVLAGVQQLDYEALAEGTIRLVPEEARQRTELTLDDNLKVMGLARWSTVRIIQLRVYNAAPGAPIRDAWSGQYHEYPTVCLVLESRVTPLLPVPLQAISLRVHADASVEPRER